MKSLVVFCLLVSQAFPFSFESPRIFVATPVSENPKKAVLDFMTASPLVLTRDTAVDDAMSSMLSHKTMTAPVLDEDRHVVGVVSSMDFLHKEAFEGALLPMTKEDAEMYANAAKKIVCRTVADVMTTNPATIHPEATMREAALVMNQWKLHGLPVVDDNEVFEGWLWSSDVMLDLLHVTRELPPSRESL